MNNDVVNSGLHSTDTHGYSEIIFGTTHLLDFSFAPRIKNFKKQRLYSFKKIKDYKEKEYKILPYGYINENVIKDNWDDILRFITTIKLKKATASDLFNRLSSYSKHNPLYRALKSFGRIIKTIFLLKYIDDLSLRQRIEKQLNKIESANRFAKAVFFGNNQEFQCGTKEEQIVTESCKRLIENTIICWNYIFLTHKIASINKKDEKMKLIKTLTNGSVVVWQHINMHGEYDFSENKLKDRYGFKKETILSLKL